MGRGRVAHTLTVYDVVTVYTSSVCWARVFVEFSQRFNVDASKLIIAVVGYHSLSARVVIPFLSVYNVTPRLINAPVQIPKQSYAGASSPSLTMGGRSTPTSDTDDRSARNYTVSQIKRDHFYFLNSSVIHWPILIIFGMQHQEETWHK